MEAPFFLLSNDFEQRKQWRKTIVRLGISKAHVVVDTKSVWGVMRGTIVKAYGAILSDEMSDLVNGCDLPCVDVVAFFRHFKLTQEVQDDLRDDDIARIMRAVEIELRRASSKFSAFSSAHEGYAILKEEVDELWDDVKANRLEAARKEAVQVAAMAMRFLLDVRSQSDMDNTVDGAPK